MIARARFVPAFVALLALGVAVWAVTMLERERGGLLRQDLTLAGAPVTLLRPQGEAPLPLVVVAHGYAGSRQMMRALSTMLGQNGFSVAALDLPGHGRHAQPMTGDITRLDGATARLVDHVVAVTEALRQRPDIAGPVALVGHSMATDIVIRAAARLPDVAAITAISMYSDAVTPHHPARLLIISGAQEGRLRSVALDAARQIDPAAGEGETVATDEVQRRAVAAPLVGHVGVLYAATTLIETRDWIAAAMAVPATALPPQTGLWIGLLLTAVVASAWPLATTLGPARPIAPLLGRRTAIRALVLPILPALAATTLLPDGLLGLAAFGKLAAFLGVWGVVQMVVLWRAGHRPAPPRALGTAVLLFWGLGVFALALDRYGAAFLPTGPRLPVLALLLPSALIFTLADAALTGGAGWVIRSAARLLPLITLLAAMLLAPMLGVAFTVIPVMILFWLVYGLAARWVAARTGPTTAGVALGVILAWAIAASTPLIALGGP